LTRRIDDPQCGHFRTRLVKGGPMVPARIWRECRCTVNGETPHDWRDTCDRYPPLTGEIDGSPAEVERVWTSGEAIPEREYRFMVADAEWCRQNAPADPKSSPRQPVDFRSMPLPF